MRRFPLVAALLVLLAGCGFLAGCGGGSDVPPPAGPPATQLKVGLIDYRFQLSAGTLKAGPVTVTATDAGSSRHDVVLTQDGREIGRSRVLAPGEKQTFTIQVAPQGEVHLECTLPGHDAAGMHATVSVAG